MLPNIDLGESRKTSPLNLIVFKSSAHHDTTHADAHNQLTALRERSRLPRCPVPYKTLIVSILKTEPCGEQSLAVVFPRDGAERSEFNE